jgi:hypothetical protein
LQIARQRCRGFSPKSLNSGVEDFCPIKQLAESEKDKAAMKEKTTKVRHAFQTPIPELLTQNLQP